MSMKYFFQSLLFAMLSTFSSATLSTNDSNEALIVEFPWPENVPCQGCLAIINGWLSFDFPRSNIKEIRVNEMTLNITLNTKNKNEHLVIIEMDETKITGGMNTKLYKKIGVTNYQEFMDKIGTVDKNNEALIIARKVMAIDRARDYIKYKKGDILAYWVNVIDDDISRTLYVFNPKDNKMFLISGGMSQERVNLILNSLEL